MALRVSDVTEDERAKLDRVARAKTAPVRLVERTRIVLLALEGLTSPRIAARVGVGEATAQPWIKRFNAAGPAGLGEAPRPGRPAKPEGAEAPPACHWALDRLLEEINKDGVPITRGRIRRLLRAEHIKWQKPRAWLESDDPEFTEKRGPSSGSTASPRRAAP